MALLRRRNPLRSLELASRFAYVLGVACLVAAVWSAMVVSARHRQDWFGMFACMGVPFVAPAIAFFILGFRIFEYRGASALVVTIVVASMQLLLFVVLLLLPLLFGGDAAAPPDMMCVLVALIVLDTIEILLCARSFSATRGHGGSLRPAARGFEPIMPTSPGAPAPPRPVGAGYPLPPTSLKRDRSTHH